MSVNVTDLLSSAFALWDDLGLGLGPECSGVVNITAFIHYSVSIFRLMCLAPVTCPAGTHQCPGRSRQRCVDENSFCDGTDDCGDNTDEDMSICGLVGQSVSY